MDTFRHSGHRVRRICRTRSGFSLVEVTMAIGVFGFAFSALIGLIPMGMNNFRQAMDTSVRAQICQRVMNDVQQTDFEMLTSNSLDDRYFDEEGNELIKSSRYVYQVKTVVYGTTAAPSATDAFSSVATVLVQIANNPAHLDPSINQGTGAWSDSRLSIASFPCLVSRNKYRSQ